MFLHKQLTGFFKINREIENSFMATETFGLIRERRKFWSLFQRPKSHLRMRF